MAKHFTVRFVHLVRLQGISGASERTKTTRTESSATPEGDSVMSTANFTQGEWVYDETTLSICRLIVSIEDVQAFQVSPLSDSGHAIAYIPCDVARDTQEANARLICAAPDLLAALRDLVHQLPTDEHLADYNLDLAEAAIAKATGETQ